MTSENVRVVGSKATYMCNSGYTFAESSDMERICQASGKWSNENILCGNYNNNGIEKQFECVVV